jgi:hypothetical protein
LETAYHGILSFGTHVSPFCVTKNGSNVQISSKTFAMGLQWMPGLPWFEAGQVVFVETDTDGVQFENVAFDNVVPALDSYTSLVVANANSSGWSMTM